MYALKKVKIPRTKRTKLIIKDLTNLEGFLMPTRSKKFTIEDMIVENLILTNKKLVYPIVSKKVNKLYKRLLLILTELLTTDDDSGQTYAEALNQIERFRLQIKNKYRYYLNQKELQTMSNQLKLIQIEAKKRLFEIEDTYNIINTSGKSR